MKGLLVISALALLLAGCAKPTTVREEVSSVLAEQEANKQRLLAMQSYMDARNRLFRLSYPLLLASEFFCEEEHKGYLAGYWRDNLNGLREEWREVAIAEYDFGKASQVTYIIPGSPAAKAGLRVGDVLVKFDGENLPLEGNSISKIWDDSADDGRVVIGVLRDERALDVDVELIHTCRYPVILAWEQDLNAQADGDKIVINRGLMRFLNDNELSAVIAHEIAHNTMQHMEAIEQNAAVGMLADILIIGTTGVDPGIRNATAQAYMQEFEAEADYVSIYIMARAGLEIEDVPNIWRRMAAEGSSTEKDISATHPSSPERFIALENAIREVQKKIANGEPLEPNIKEE